MSLYNINRQNIYNGLDNKEIAGSFDYLILLSAPAGANVRVRLNENTAPEIPLPESFAIKSKNVERIFISSDAIENGSIVLGQSNKAEDFEIITAPIVKDIEEVAKIREIEGFSSTLLQELDKVINPYIFKEMLSGVVSSTSSLTLFNAVLDVDMIDITIGLGRPSVTDNMTGGMFYASLDGDFFIIGGNHTTSAGASHSGESRIREKRDHVRGKRLKIYGNAGRANERLYYLLEKYNKKA